MVWWVVGSMSTDYFSADVQLNFKPSVMDTVDSLSKSMG